MQVIIPMIGSAVGAWKWSLTVLSLRSTRTARFTTAKTPSRSSAVVPPRVATTSALPNETKTIRPKAMVVVNRMAPGCATGGVDLAQHRRQHTLAGHPVDEPAGHQHVDQRRVRDGEHRDERQDVADRQTGRARLDHLDQRRVRLGQGAD